MVGDTISRTISLTNSGALGTTFKVQTSAGATSTLRATVKAAPARVVGPKSTSLKEQKCSALGGVVELCRVTKQLGSERTWEDHQPLVHLGQ